MRALPAALLLSLPILAVAAPPTATLSWTPSTLRVDGSLVGPSFFAVYAGVGSGNEVLFRTGITTPSFVVTGVSGQTWCFYVTQIETGGAESLPSVEVCKTFATSPPLPPTGVTVK